MSAVRELFGVMAARGATGAYVVSIGRFSRDALAFAEGRNIELVDANTLLRADRRTSGASVRPPPAAVHTPACPRCGAAMVRRVAKQGVHRGQAFYGCGSYPKCRGLRPAG